MHPLKIFISHSSSDQWVARRIAHDLVELGATTFLDEKDFETGESIDDSIQAHLKDSDELLILLSPAALNSAWVLIEIGGAKALGLRLIPILMHVGANELPQPISMHLARELNAIDAYYEEVTARLSSSIVEHVPQAAPPLKREPDPVRQFTFKAGDRVRLLPVAEHRADRPEVGWVRGMETYVDEVAEVTRDDPEQRMVQVDLDGMKFWWAFEWLVPYGRDLGTAPGAA
jgi:TIR domain